MSTLTQTTFDEIFLDFLGTEAIVPAPALAILRTKSNEDQNTFERLLIEGGYMTDGQVSLTRAQMNGWHSVDLHKEALKPEMKNTIPEKFAKRSSVLVYCLEDTTVHVASSNPTNGRILRLLEKKFGKEISMHFVTHTQLHEKLNALYDEGIQRRIANLTTGNMQGENEAATVELVDTILLHAARENASDIHIEPNARDVLVRERVDGILRTVTSLTKPTHEHLVQRIKVLSRLATDEHMQPQDGKFTVENLDGKRADVRVSIVPTGHGEDIVLRLLVTENHSMPLETLGMDKDQLEIMAEEMKKAWGMILVTGPTGSGKTTSLYATVLKIQSEEISISSIEDPVEYDLPGTNQIQVHEKIGVSFAVGLRSLMRHDPDVILVGEIRDSDTASTAVNAALTGHLVLSTLHTNDAPSAAPRLCDMGIEPFLLSSTVNLIIAQRLVRTICPQCKEGHDVKTVELQKILPMEAVQYMMGKKKQIRLYAGKGCNSCGGKGFRGRIGIFEFLRMNDAIRTLIMQRADADMIRKEARRNGMKTMMEDGMTKILEGQTTIEEVLRVTRL